MTSNLPDIHELDREIPAGKVLIAECRDIGPDDPRPQRFVLETKTGWGRTKVTLAAVTAGWAVAGSMMRWDNGHYSVSWQSDNATHGSRYKSVDDAMAHFNRIPETEYA